MAFVRRTSQAVALAALLLAYPAIGWADDGPTLVERATSDTVTDLDPKGDSAGDILTFANDIYDADNKKKVGTDQGWCIRVVAGKSWECFWTLTLEKGQITVEGPFYDAGDSVLAVTGGTGAYSKARGQMKLHSRKPDGSEYDFKYELH